MNDKHSIMRMVFLGPPGSGKGTQSELLSHRLNMVHISTGDTLRKIVEDPASTLGCVVGPLIKQGQLVSDDIMNEVVQERLTQSDCRERGYILDGYPRTLGQAQALTCVLKGAGLALTHVFLFKIDDDMALKRIGNRAASALEAKGQTRSDDNVEISKKRLALYRAQIQGLAHYYKDSNLLTEVDAACPVPEVTAFIMRHLGQKIDEQA